MNNKVHIEHCVYSCDDVCGCRVRGGPGRIHTDSRLPHMRGPHVPRLSSVGHRHPCVDLCHEFGLLLSNKMLKHHVPRRLLDTADSRLRLRPHLRRHNRLVVRAEWWLRVRAGAVRVGATVVEALRLEALCRYGALLQLWAPDTRVQVSWARVKGVDAFITGGEFITGGDEGATSSASAACT